MKRNRTIAILFRVTALAAAAGCLTGCVNLKKSYPEKKYYILEAPRREKPRQADSGTTVTILQVRPYRVSPGFEGQEFVYRTGEMRYESDFYNQFFIAPSMIFTEQTQQWLARSGLFDHVIGASSPLDPMLTLEESATAFFGDYSNPESPKAVMEIQFLLLRETQDNPRILLRKDLRAETPLDGPGAEALVRAWSEALRQILGKLEEEMRPFASL